MRFVDQTCDSRHRSEPLAEIAKLGLGFPGIAEPQLGIVVSACGMAKQTNDSQMRPSQAVFP